MKLTRPLCIISNLIRYVLRIFTWLLHSFLLLVFRVRQELLYKEGVAKLTTSREKIRQTVTIEVVCTYHTAQFTAHAVKDKKAAYFYSKKSIRSSKHRYLSNTQYQNGQAIKLLTIGAIELNFMKESVGFVRKEF